MEREVKILLLGRPACSLSSTKRIEAEHIHTGAGESGKTTVLKQMKVIHAVGFSPQELDHYRRQVFQNLWDGMRACLEAMQVFGLRLGSDSSRVGDIDTQ
jgi:guanine nucleotide-binding protein subunit alpha